MLDMLATGSERDGMRERGRRTLNESREKGG
jgi:hypothetical protein